MYLKAINWSNLLFFLLLQSFFRGSHLDVFVLKVTFYIFSFNIFRVNYVLPLILSIFISFIDVTLSSSMNEILLHLVHILFNFFNFLGFLLLYFGFLVGVKIIIEVFIYGVNFISIFFDFLEFRITGTDLNLLLILLKTCKIFCKRLIIIFFLICIILGLYLFF